ncbi:hypothetical protein VCHENC02_3098B, partial [Vibrio harveyi]
KQLDITRQTVVDIPYLIGHTSILRKAFSGSSFFKLLRQLITTFIVFIFDGKIQLDDQLVNL